MPGPLLLSLAFMVGLCACSAEDATSGQARDDSPLSHDDAGYLDAAISVQDGASEPPLEEPLADAGLISDAGGPDASSAGKAPSLQGCRGPLDPGCAVCRDDVAGKPSYLSASAANVDWYNVRSSSAPVGCDGACPTCASCSYHDQQDLAALGERPECLPCPANTGLDPCYGPGSCTCWCSLQAALKASCPTLAQ
ncbi:MAG: hypothetical protein QM778_29065 [Myxococcales bacterium]